MNICESCLDCVSSHELKESGSRVSRGELSDKRVLLAGVEEVTGNLVPDGHGDVGNLLTNLLVEVIVDIRNEVLLIWAASELAPEALEVCRAERAVAEERVDGLIVKVHLGDLIVVAANVLVYELRTDFLEHFDALADWLGRLLV